jgi:FKBP-type peptidyl-prolyl cis-trans isomerases 1
MNRKHLFLLVPVLALMVSLSSCEGRGRIGKASLKTDRDSASYAIGVLQGDGLKRGLKQSNLDLDEKILLAAMRDAMSGDSTAVLIKIENAQMFLQTYMQKMEEVKKEENFIKGREFLEENKKQADVQITPSGLQYKILTEGSGDKPAEYDTVEVHYRGTLIDGTEFESSYSREPVRFALNSVIKGWTEGVQLMNVGSKYTFYIPTELAYGENVYPGSPIEPNVPLIFDIELISITKGEKPVTDN